MMGRMLNSSNSVGVWALHEVYFAAVRGQPRPAGSRMRCPSSWTWCLRGRGQCTGTGPVDSCTVHGCMADV